MRRREFINYSILWGGAALIPIGTDGWIHRSSAKSNPQPKRTIAIFLRGAVDGLSVVVPYREPEYYRLRPNIAIPQPGQKDGALDLDGQFGLHPALSSIYPLWQEKSLAFVHASGSPDVTRSHFEAQERMEIGAFGVKGVNDGWLNRLVGHLSGRNPIQAVSVGATTPRILMGQAPTANMASGRSASNKLQIDRPQVAAAFDRLYRDRNPIGNVYRQGRAAREELLKDLEAEMQMANNGAPLPNGFAGDARRVARLMVRDPRIQVAFLGVGGWDTHINQAGLLSRNLEQLGKGLAVLKESLAEIYADTSIVVISEFGRTVKENGNRGTDHGHGNVIWLLGGGVAGGRIYGQWPTLNPDRLYQGRDLAVSTDFRAVMSGLFQRSFGIERAQLSQIFPGYTGGAISFY
jgi:uncharacterized protein (DUF1501 family)